MGGLLSTMSTDSWINGFNASFISEMSSGDFYAGADKDLLTEVFPIRNLEPSNPLMYYSDRRIDDGFSAFANITKMRLVNM